jgi:hypothetical protein
MGLEAVEVVAPERLLAASPPPAESSFVRRAGGGGDAAVEETRMRSSTADAGAMAGGIDVSVPKFRWNAP